MKEIQRMHMKADRNNVVNAIQLSCSGKSYTAKALESALSCYKILSLTNEIERG